MDPRISREEWFLEMAQVQAKRSTCLRRAVGCVLVNRRGHVLSTGYNGVAAGQPNCNEVVEMPVVGGHQPIYPHACPGVHAASGTDLDGCYAIHAEQNALLQCPDAHAILYAYVTVSPCVTCTKLLLNTSCKIIHFGEEYTQGAIARDLWRAGGRVWARVPRTQARG